MNNLNEMGIITVTGIRFFNGKQQVTPTDDVRSVLLNGKFVSKGCTGYGNVFITADEYNAKIAGKHVADVIQVLCLGETTETKTSAAGKQYISVNVDDHGRKLIKVTEGDEVAKSFTDEVHPMVKVMTVEATKPVLSV